MDDFIGNELLSSLTIGTILIIVNYVVFCFLVNKNALPSWARPKTKNENPGQNGFGKASLLSLALISALTGIFLEVASDVIANTGASPVLPSDKENRDEVLYELDEKSTKRLSALGNDLAKLKIFSEFGGNEGKVVQDAFEKGTLANIDPDILSGAASLVYYNSKNRVFLERNYYDELSAIQKRIDFVRSTSLIFLIATCYALMMLIIHRPRAKRRADLITRFLYGNIKCYPRLNSHLKRATVLVFCLTLFFSCRFAFANMEQDFNRRVFGYFRTNIITGNFSYPVPSPKSLQNESTLPGISGIAPWINPKQFIVAHDTKRVNPGSRIGLLTVSNDTIGYKSVKIQLPENMPPPSDIESICAVPGEPGRYLAAESSSYHQDTGGRIFDLSIKSCSGGNIVADISNVFSLPKELGHRNPDHPDQEWKQIEGMVCAQIDGKNYLLLGEREDGDIYWALLEKNISFSMIKGSGAPEGFDRAIAALSIDPKTSALLAIATTDPGKNTHRGDVGPFRSIVYEIGLIDESGIQLMVGSIRWHIDGYKAEGLSITDWSDAPFCIGSDDESTGSSWRLLPAFSSMQKK
ncbi:MAG: hypothetical protein ACSHYA_18480 [Opitutaceae bacterium]